MQVKLPISGIQLTISNPIFVPTSIPGEVQVQSYDAIDQATGLSFEDYDSLPFRDLVTLEETLMQMAYEQSGYSQTEHARAQRDGGKRVPRER